jgi:hypothetical protein
VHHPRPCQLAGRVDAPQSSSSILTVTDVILAQGDQASGLASMMGTLLAQNVAQHPAKSTDLRRLRGDVLIDVSDLQEQVTLQFSGGVCTVQNGAVGRPKVRLRTDSATLMGLSAVRIGPLGLPNYVDANGRAVIRAMVGRRLRIKGMRHVATLNRVTRLFSVMS